MEQKKEYERLCFTVIFLHKPKKSAGNRIMLRDSEIP